MKEFKILMDDAHKVYNFLEDEISKQVFLSRLEYNITSTQQSLDRLLEFASSDIKYKKHMRSFEFIDNNIEDNIIIYSCGNVAKNILPKVIEKFKNANIIFCDKNYSSISDFEGFKVISPEELIDKYRECNTIIATVKYFDEVYDFLQKYLNKEKIYSYGFAFDTDCYFPKDIISFGENEIFVDGGSYDADTSINFIKRTNYNYNKVCVFEPDLERIGVIKENLQYFNNVNVYNTGLWSEKDNLEFKIIENGSSKIVKSNGDISVRVNSIDEICKGEKVTFIKLDIEGAELSALKGAKETITKYKPKLAICLYHKVEDIIEIPLFIKEIMPEYKIFIRHHSSSRLDTVLYAVL